VSKLLFLILFLLALAAPAVGQQDPSLLPSQDIPRAQEMRSRAADWRNGVVVYQIFVDRFAPSSSLEQKRALYTPPRKLRDWNELPRKGTYLENDQVWSHEIDFWGGDLSSVQERLDYLQELGVDVVYLNPIFASLTNHKYDAWDYHTIDLVYGDRPKLRELADDLHKRGMRLVLDGVFNHMGRKSPYFQEAQANPASPWRDFFQWRSDRPQLPVTWLDVDSLPELNLENPEVQDYIYAKPDSVVQSYLRQEGIDGWRLDVAYDLGFKHLSALTRGAHAAKAGSLVVGEIWGYPEDWYPAVDGVMNMHGRALILRMLEGTLPGPLASSMWETMIDEAGYDHILKAWIVLDNHDTPRLADALPLPWQVTMARVLQFTLPGSVCLYYGSEVGMTGGEDPESRAPMRWDLVTDDNDLLVLHRKLLKLRKEHPALRYGDFRRLHSQRLFAFLRRTVWARETLVVLANPSDAPVREYLQLRDSKVLDITVLRDLLGSAVAPTVFSGCIDVELAPHQIVVLQADVSAYPKGYSRYDRVR
jgi:glycosidase